MSPYKDIMDAWQAADKLAQEYALESAMISEDLREEVGTDVANYIDLTSKENYDE